MTNETNTVPNEAQVPVDTGIGINDLVLARNIIQVASKRGAFTDPTEYQEIGKLFNKLDAFITGVEDQVAKQKQDADESADSKDSTNES